MSARVPTCMRPSTLSSEFPQHKRETSIKRSNRWKFQHLICSLLLATLAERLSRIQRLRVLVALVVRHVRHGDMAGTFVCFSHLLTWENTSLTNLKLARWLRVCWARSRQVWFVTFCRFRLMSVENRRTDGQTDKTHSAAFRTAA